MTEINELLTGYRRFYSRHFLRQDTYFAQLVTQGQAPKTLIIACSDSRVDPAIVLDADPGDIFVVRNVANLVPPYAPDGSHHGTSSALEFGVCNLKVRNIIVLGHSACAGIGSLLADSHGQSGGSFIPRWMDIAREARDYTIQCCGDASHPDARQLCEQQAMLISLRNLLTFSWIRERVESGELVLHGWYFNLSTGELSQWNEAAGSFVAVSPEL